MRLLTLKIQEPLPGTVLPMMIDEHGPDEAARRYRAISVTTLRQLRGLADVRIRILSDPCDAEEALRFWLLPRLADGWQSNAGVFRCDGWEIDFGGTCDGFEIESEGEILCPFLGSRWVHAALLGVERGGVRVTGPATDTGEYFSALPTRASGPLTERMLPGLPIVQTDQHWRDALTSPLGPALKRAWEEEA